MAVRALLRNVPFFAREPDFVEIVFDDASDFVDPCTYPEAYVYAYLPRVGDDSHETQHLCGS
jgi:hypothetical protein